eukprot:4149476-Amphidinium_carterae.1
MGTWEHILGQTPKRRKSTAWTTGASTVNALPQALPGSCNIKLACSFLRSSTSICIGCLGTQFLDHEQ